MTFKKINKIDSKLFFHIFHDIISPLLLTWHNTKIISSEFMTHVIFRIISSCAPFLYRMNTILFHIFHDIIISPLLLTWHDTKIISSEFMIFLVYLLLGHWHISDHVTDTKKLIHYANDNKIITITNTIAHVPFLYRVPKKLSGNRCQIRLLLLGVNVCIEIPCVCFSLAWQPVYKLESCESMPLTKCFPFFPYVFSIIFYCIYTLKDLVYYNEYITNNYKKPRIAECRSVHAKILIDKHNTCTDLCSDIQPIQSLTGMTAEYHHVSISITPCTFYRDTIAKYSHNMKDLAQKLLGGWRSFPEHYY
ncbi:hypothetical protein ACJX0J_019151 [Zea mays]